MKDYMYVLMIGTAVFFAGGIMFLLMLPPTISVASPQPSAFERVQTECNKSYDKDSDDAIKCWLGWAAQKEYDYNKRKLEETYQRAR